MAKKKKAAVKKPRPKIIGGHKDPKKSTKRPKK